MAYRQSELLEAAARVHIRLVPIDGAKHVFYCHDEIDTVVRMPVDYIWPTRWPFLVLITPRSACYLATGVWLGNPGSPDLRLRGASRQLVSQAIDQADPRTDQLMEHLVVRSQSVWPRRCKLLGSLNLARKLDQLFARNSGSQLGELLSLFIIDVVPQ